MYALASGPLCANHRGDSFGLQGAKCWAQLNQGIDTKDLQAKLGQ